MEVEGGDLTLKRRVIVGGGERSLFDWTEQAIQVISDL